MKILLTTLLCLCLSLPVLADQQTTVLTEQTSVGKATATLPYIDGSNSAELENRPTHWCAMLQLSWSRR